MRLSSRPVVGLTALALIASLGLSACSSKKNTASGGSSSSSSCGTVPSNAPSDTDGVLASLSSDVKALYNGYPTAIHKSAFADWKPSSSTNKTVGFLLSETNNGYQLALQSILEGQLKAAGYTVDAVTSSDQVTDQVADFNQMVEQKVALIPGHWPNTALTPSNAAMSMPTPEMPCTSSTLPEPPISLATYWAISAPCSQSFAPTLIVSALPTEFSSESDGMPAEAAVETAVVKAEEDSGS